MTAKFFISHDFTARNDEKILILRADLGLEGYGIWWAFIEVLAEHDGCIEESNLRGVAFGIQCSWELFQEFICLCFDLGLLKLDEGKVFSESLNKRLEYKRDVSRKRSEAGKRGAIAKQLLNKSQAIDKQNQANQNPNLNQNQNNKEEKAVDVSTTTKPKKSKARLLPEDRLKRFKDSIRESGAEVYSVDMLTAFYEYWTEPMQNKHIGMFRWEVEKTWGLDRRLSTWAKKSLDFNESPYKPQVMRGNSLTSEDKKKKDIEVLTAFLLDPPEASNLQPRLEEYKKLTGREWSAV
jgi:hypothetical protein